MPGIPTECRPLLRAVSRTFALSLQFLPGSVRGQIAVAYLFARAADSIADAVDPTLDVAQRISLLNSLVRALAETTTRAEFVAHLDQWRGNLADQALAKEEIALLGMLPALFNAFDQFSTADREQIAMVLGKITTGQSDDLRFFGSGGEPGGVRRLGSPNELERYIYHVAGSVGEFWTLLVGNHVPKANRASLEEMCRLGREFGGALQLVNILRDIGEDASRGRCYIPARPGVPEEDIHAASLPWLVTALDRVRSGFQYAGLTRGFRLRFAVVLPAFLAEATLRRLEEAGRKSLVSRVKVPRKELRRLVFRALVFALRPSHSA